MHERRAVLPAHAIAVARTHGAGKRSRPDRGVAPRHCDAVLVASPEPDRLPRFMHERSLVRMLFAPHQANDASSVTPSRGAPWTTTPPTVTHACASAGLSPLTPRCARQSIRRRRSIEVTATARGKHTGCHGRTVATRSTARPIRIASRDASAGGAVGGAAGWALPSSAVVSDRARQRRRRLATVRVMAASAASGRRLIHQRNTNRF